MSYKPGGSYYKEFVTASPTTGAAANADSLPTATANHNGTDDGAFSLTVTGLDAGRYKITGTIPGGYASGDVLNVSVAATCGSVAGKAVVDTQVIDSKRLSDLNDSAYAGGAVASVTAAVNLNLAQTGLTPRALDSVADASLTVGDALVSAISGAAGKESVVGTGYQVKTPFTGTVIRSFTLDSATAPTSRS